MGMSLYWRLGQVGGPKGIQEVTQQIWRYHYCTSWRLSLSLFLPRTDSQQSQQCHKLINIASSFSVLTPFYWHGNLKSLIVPQDTGMRQEGNVFVFVFTSLSSLVTARLTGTMMKAAVLFHLADFVASSQRVWPIWLLSPAWFSPLCPLTCSWLVLSLSRKSMNAAEEAAPPQKVETLGIYESPSLSSCSCGHSTGDHWAVVSQATMELVEWITTTLPWMEILQQPEL